MPKRKRRCARPLPAAPSPARRLYPEGKLTAPDFPGWQTAADFVLVEADGSRRLPAKAHAPWEPVLPPKRRRTVCVFGASALGKPIRDAAHRPELYAPLAAASPDAVITPVMAARVLAAEGGFDVLFINQADVLTGAAAQLRPFADILPCPVVLRLAGARRMAQSLTPDPSRSRYSKRTGRGISRACRLSKKVHPDFFRQSS